MRTMDKPWYPVVFMFVVTAVFSTVVIAVSQMTRESVQANARVAFERAVASSLGLASDSTPNAEVHSIFAQQVKQPKEGTGGAYYFEKDGAIQGYAILMQGKGFWDVIKGVMGVAADRKTVTGIAFYQLRETPGLGAEITKAGFRDQFKGKVLATSEKAIAIKRPGASIGSSDVYAVTGATQTSSRVESFVNSSLREWQKKMAGKGGAE
jgi:Na+-transporting NADH:ubiquinone oxidoreductase subunit C